MTGRAINIAWLLAPREVAQLLIPGREIAQAHGASTAGGPRRLRRPRSSICQVRTGEMHSRLRLARTVSLACLQPKNSFQTRSGSSTDVTQPPQAGRQSHPSKRRGERGAGSHSLDGNGACLKSETCHLSCDHR